MVLNVWLFLVAIFHSFTQQSLASPHHDLDPEDLDGPSGLGLQFLPVARYIVKYKPDAKHKILQGAKSLKGHVKKDIPELNAMVMEFEENGLSPKMMAQLDEVEYVEKDPVRYLMSSFDSDSAPALPLSRQQRRFLQGESDRETPSPAPEAEEQAEEDLVPKIDLYGLRMVEAEIVQRVETDAEGKTKVCVMDTGYTPEHIDLPDRPWAIGDPSPASSCNTRSCCCNRATGICSTCAVSPCTCDEGHTSQICRDTQGCPDMDPFNDKAGHGTHVAGTVLALDNGGGVKGVCPMCQPVINRLFSDDGHFAYASDVAGAVLKCQQKGAKVINASIGGTEGSRLEWETFSKLYREGVIVFASSGNGGSPRVSYPAGYTGVLGVGAVDDEMKRARFSQYNFAVDITGPGVDVISTVPLKTGSFGRSLTLEFSTGTPTESMKIFGGTAMGVLPPTQMCTTGLLVEASDGCSGKMCVIPRGEHLFQDKVDTCKEHGGVAAVIYNNVERAFNSAVEQPEEHKIFVVSMSKEEGEALVASLQEPENANATATMEIGEPTHYGEKSGTSMSCPHAAGVAGLLWSKHPDCDAETIRTAFLSSADALKPGNATNCPPGISAAHCFGQGVINAASAMESLCDPLNAEAAKCVNAKACESWRGLRDQRVRYEPPAPEEEEGEGKVPGEQAEEAEGEGEGRRRLLLRL
uniref:subtilisin n=1 Tax=Chromera velia CCMP2878 TaxID=1169474 RepID=A0A0G4HND7_9ALVE|eukprot:Cvel_7633.t1-p1 / transcript=Cvel_7633.t1 / gene=Cvel_7633 / organism=Chromera_velia_CCMP2878 / gene_product=Subtilisin DY, putative / transcript_product=Subtilisin DY, putative / location=Cvel_scaffold403:45650-48805(+) / protein_length=693 / sequence_SO=supercontig / SO=protein_coding / is_pseudo=false